VRRAGALFLLVALLPRPAGAEPPELELLRSYLRIDTSNPPGNERPAALLLQKALSGAGIASELYEAAPGRTNLYARLKGSGKPGLLLHHHLDVVPADPKDWHLPPFAGGGEGNKLTGRGVLDDKALGIAELQAFLALKGQKLSRDVVFLATADEEAGGALGVAALRKARPAWFAGLGFALGEGGVTETVVDVQRYFGIEIAQKSALWLRLTARGAGGHPGSPERETATGRLAKALGSLASWRRPFVVEREVEEVMKLLAAVRPPTLAALFSDIRAAAARDPERLDRELTPRYRSLLMDLVSITRLGPEGKATNVLPRVAWAEVDCRLLPSTDVDAFLAELKTRIAPQRLEVEMLLSAPAGAPSPKSELYDLVAARMKRRFPTTVVGPDISPGMSENRVLRAMGLVTYGITPFRVNVYDQAGIHGSNERIRTDWFVEGVALLTDIVRDFAR